MFTVERKRSFDQPAERLHAIVADPNQLGRLMPRAERVEVLSQTENRARVAIVVRLGKLGTQRVEGEARRLDDGLRFVAVQPMQIDVRWTIMPRDTSTDVSIRVAAEAPPKMAGMARFIPQRMIEDRIGAELEGALNALANAAAEPTE